jgi:hypothetical protein
MDELHVDWLSQFPDLEEFEGLPAELVPGRSKIEGLKLYPEKGGRRVVVDVAITPTRQRPNLEIGILAPDGTVVAETCVVGLHGARQVVTMHLRSPDPLLTYTVKVGLFQENELIDTCETQLTWPH